MRGGKSFLILLALVAAIGGYAYFVESKREPGADDAAKKAKVFTVDQAKIDEVEVKAAAGDLTRLKKDGGTWRITLPATYDADQSDASSLVSSLPGIEVGHIVDEKPASLKDYGLDPARISVGYRVTGDQTMHRLLIGVKTPVGSDLYAQVEGQPKVFLIGAFNEDTFNKTTFNLREKTALKFARESVTSVKIDQAGKAVTIAKEGNAWRLGAPTGARADQGAVEGIVSKLADAKMKALTSDAPAPGAADMKKWGLDKPVAVVTVVAGSANASLAFGAKADDTSIYARDLSRPLVFTVESTLFDEIKKKPDDLRQKDLFESRSFSTITLDVTVGGQTFSYGKQKTGSGDTATEVWKQTKPAVKDVDQTKFTDFMSAMAGLRAESFTDKAAAGDQTTFTATYGDATSPKNETVTFHVAKDKTGSKVTATRPGEPGAAVVSSTEWDKLFAMVKDLTGVK
jgi:hypothetical protein